MKPVSSSLIAAKRLEPNGRIVHAFLLGYVVHTALDPLTASTESLTSEVIHSTAVARL